VRGMQRSTRVRRGHTSAQKDKILAAYQRSGLSQKDFASQAGIGHSTLTLWLRQAASKDGAPFGFVAVPNLLAASPTAAAYRLKFPQGLILEVPPGFGSAELSTLLQLVRAL
jgi:transposase-like protein